MEIWTSIHGIPRNSVIILFRNSAEINTNSDGSKKFRRNSVRLDTGTFYVDMSSNSQCNICEYRVLNTSWPRYRSEIRTSGTSTIRYSVFKIMSESDLLSPIPEVPISSSVGCPSSWISAWGLWSFAYLASTLQSMTPRVCKFNSPAINIDLTYI